MNLQKLDLEDQRRIGGNVGHGFAAVGKMRGNGDAAFTTDAHAGDANVPAFDDFAFAQLEAKRLAFLICWWKIKTSSMVRRLE